MAGSFVALVLTRVTSHAPSMRKEGNGHSVRAAFSQVARLEPRPVCPAGMVHRCGPHGRAVLHRRRTLRRACDFSLSDGLAGGQPASGRAGSPAVLLRYENQRV